MEFENDNLSDESGNSFLPGFTIVNPKVPEDQEALREFLESRSEEESSSSVIYDNSYNVSSLDQDTFVSVSLCCTIIICFFLILTRSR